MLNIITLSRWCFQIVYGLFESLYFYPYFGKMFSHFDLRICSNEFNSPTSLKTRLLHQHRPGKHMVGVFGVQKGPQSEYPPNLLEGSSQDVSGSEPTVIVSPLSVGLFPFQMAVSRLINRDY